MTHEIKRHQRTPSEPDFTPLKKMNDRVFWLIQAFHLVTSELLNPSSKVLNDIPIEEIKTLDPKERSQMIILHALKTFDSVIKGRPKVSEMLYEAIEKRHLDVMRPLIPKVSVDELNRGFDIACTAACDSRYRLIAKEMVQMFLQDSRLDSYAMGKGLAIACYFGSAALALELKYHSHLTQEALDEGFEIAYQKQHNEVLEIIKDKISSSMVGKIFVDACKAGRKDIAQRLLHHSRLSTNDLSRGLMLAERYDFATELRNSLNFRTRARLFVQSRWTPFLMGATVGIAATLVYRSLSVQTAPKLLVGPLRLPDTFWGNERCCHIK
jgi:hypothetical protein